MNRALDLQGMLASKQGIVVDLFHTLVAVEPLLEGRWRSTPSLLGIDRELWSKHLAVRSGPRMVGAITKPFEIVADLARGLDPSLSDETIAVATEARVAAFAAALLEVPRESVEAIAQLKRLGKRLALLSNADTIDRAGWRQSPLAPLFDCALFSCDIGLAKPDLRCYAMALERLGVSAGEACFVGDGASDELAGAKRAGLTTVMVTGFLERFNPGDIGRRRQDADYEVSWVSRLPG